MRALRQLTTRYCISSWPFVLDVERWSAFALLNIPLIIERVDKRCNIIIFCQRVSTINGWRLVRTVSHDSMKSESVGACEEDRVSVRLKCYRHQLQRRRHLARVVYNLISVP